MEQGKGAGVYMTALEAKALDNALDLISTTLESASIIPPELTVASEGLHSLREKFFAARRRENGRKSTKQRGADAVRLALAMIAEDEKTAGSTS